MYQLDLFPDLPRAATSGSLETREVRWFASGVLPAEVAKWYDGNGRAKLVEHRTDSYLLTGRPDLGIKRRGRSLLEVKRRTAREGAVYLADIGAGRIETWTKAPHPQVEEGPEGRWVDVDKAVLTEKHHFDSDQGSAICDVEIASIRANGVSAWTLAFEAYGPDPVRSVAFDTTLELFESTHHHPVRLEELTLSAGYPEWLESIDAIAGRGYESAMPS